MSSDIGKSFRSKCVLPLSENCGAALSELTHVLLRYKNSRSAEEVWHLCTEGVATSCRRRRNDRQSYGQKEVIEALRHPSALQGMHAECMCIAVWRVTVKYLQPAVTVS